VTTALTHAIGAPADRVEGREKVTGEARYAYEVPVEHVAYAAPVQAAVARGRLLGVDAGPALALEGVLAVLSYVNAPHLEPVDDRELDLFQTDEIHYCGQIVAAVVADTLEVANAAVPLVRLDVEEAPHDVELRAAHPRLYAPEKVNAGYATDSAIGDFRTAYAEARVTIDCTYTTPAYHNNPLEPHATTAVWEEGGLTLYDSNQGAHAVRDVVARLFALPPERVRVVAQHVGGGFGSKGMARPQLVIAALASQLTGRPVKAALTRQQLFAVAGYRTPTIQRIRLGAERNGQLTALAHEVVEQCSTVNEFAEQTATPSRVMYEAENRLTTHRVVRLDVPSPSWMRAPGECPGMYALESAMDELALACDLDPIELRIRNEPPLDPESRRPWSSRHLVECLRQGAERFGWADRAARQEGRWRIGTGVAASTYPAYWQPSSALARAEAGGGFVVRIGAVDIGTGGRTAVTQIAADELGAPLARVRVEIGDSALPYATLAGGSKGTASWGWAVAKACRALRARIDEEHGRIPPEGLEATADTERDVQAREPYSMHAFGAQFAEVHVDADTGELRVPRLLGVFAAGRIVNPKTARSQLIGGMTMGMSMALHEASAIDPRFGDYVNHDFAAYHVAVNADVGEIEVAFVEEDDPHVNPLGIKGVGEIGIVGTAAAIANAVHHATGVRVRDLPIRLDAFL
jgi:xanthine dehydrogenase YagR molybdenum-binding subunit